MSTRIQPSPQLRGLAFLRGEGYAIERRKARGVGEITPLGLDGSRTVRLYKESSVSSIAQIDRDVDIDRGAKRQWQHERHWIGPSRGDGTLEMHNPVD